MFARAAGAALRTRARSSPDFAAGARSRSCPATASAAVALVARELGVARLRGGLKPADKIARLEGVTAQGEGR